jgi:8-amino-3,8-dideoxy-alpha-D-manno-octulosonate transaminase
VPGFEIFGEEERAEVGEVLETGVLFRYGFDAGRKDRWKAREFEREFAARLGAGHCHLCSSGTAALAISLAACGVGAGDEVIVPPFTFIATVEAVLQCGAVPVFAEVDDTLCLDPAGVAEKITERTRAVIVVHMCGAMAQVDALATLCDERGVTLIEDTAQAVGASLGGKSLGTFGRMGCFSFDPVKTITCGEGGAVVTDNEGLYELSHRYADHGHDHIGSDRGAEDHPVLGTNFRISELHAAVGLAQLRKLDAIIATQREHKRVLKEAFASSAEVSFRRLPDPAGDSATFLSLMMPDEGRARELASALKSAGINCFYWYENNWDYVRRWEHLKKLRTPGRSPLTLVDPVPDLRDIRVPRSDAVLSRTISMLVQLCWEPRDLEELQRKITDVLGV